MANTDLVELAVLGFLEEWEQLSVETLRERLQHNFGSYWTFGYGMLLPVVSDLDDSGYVTTVTDGKDAFPEAEKDYPYAITEDGRERLRELLRKPLVDLDDPSQQHLLVIKVGFLHLLPPEERADELEALIDRCYTLRQEWREKKDHHDAETMAPYDRHGYRVELIDLSVSMIDSLVDWLDDYRVETIEATR